MVGWQDLNPTNTGTNPGTTEHASRMQHPRARDLALATATPRVRDAGPCGQCRAARPVKLKSRKSQETKTGQPAIPAPHVAARAPRWRAASACRGHRRERIETMKQAGNLATGHHHAFTAQINAALAAPETLLPGVKPEKDRRAEACTAPHHRGVYKRAVQRRTENSKDKTNLQAGGDSDQQEGSKLAELRFIQMNETIHGPM
ncbi:hypothetical protein GUJ93_ZPchr0001g32190 [Zizania palustris]|uniref:Uncharacterized protein n=1 Tax=Zizania palustris TaxID=103762 RepID=A0A8J5RSL2_ZIZPA|nr:hypothetical protein GUJ93_ZPchr0001g32190 [Zizania palustris]